MLCSSVTTSSLKWTLPQAQNLKNSLQILHKFTPLFTYLHLPPKNYHSTPTQTLVKCSPTNHGLSPTNQDFPPINQIQEQENVGFWDKWKVKTGEMSGKMAKLGLAAVLAYGLFDGITYTSFFVLAFLGYEKSTGKNPAANIQALIGIVIMMWTGNNVTRPFRVAGAAALAPAIDNGLRRIQKALNLPRLVYAFALVAGIIATSCLTVIGLLILSKWGK